MTFEQIKNRANEIQDELGASPGSEPSDITSRLEILCMLLAESGALLSKAKYYQDVAIKDSLDKVVDNEWTASTINMYAKACAKDYNYVVNVLDRANATIGHQLDALRSILSYRKAEMNI